jgi:hypothetical protein
MITEVKTRKAFLRGMQNVRSTDCASIQSSVFQPRGLQETHSEINIGLNVRQHCLHFGKYFELKEKCLKCRYLLSFTHGDN